ncbi:MAG TPA: preQ(1) synthase [Acidobacteriota bacterium]|nr:preQ(1) synthase [Acidobacteriota bacterium]
MNESNYEDLQGDIRDWKTPEIETFGNIYADRDYEIRMAIPEFTCVCPRTGLPDFATLHLTYVPDQHCIELKSLKEYTLAYRNKGIFHENVVNKMAEDVVAAAKPRRLRLEGIFHARGGIQTTIVREYTADTR